MTDQYVDLNKSFKFECVYKEKFQQLGSYKKCRKWRWCVPKCDIIF